MTCGRNKCPHCRHLIQIQTDQKEGICDRCEKFYLVRYHLSCIKLAKEFTPRNYEAEILVFVTRKGRSYASEISVGIGASKGVVSQTLRGMISREVLIVKPRGKTKWVSIPKDK